MDGSYDALVCRATRPHVLHGSLPSPPCPDTAAGRSLGGRSGGGPKRGWAGRDDPGGPRRGALARGEIHRLQGELARAEEAYRDASRSGREPQPGLALLRLAQGDENAAAATIRRVLGEAAEPLRRAGLLPAYVEIMLSSDQLEDARSACRELEDSLNDQPGGMLGALSARASGVHLLRRRCLGRAGRSPRSVRRVASGRRAVRDGASPRAHRPRVPSARETRTPKRWSSTPPASPCGRTGGRPRPRARRAARATIRAASLGLG